MTPVAAVGAKGSINVEPTRLEPGASHGMLSTKPRVFVPCPYCNNPIELPVKDEPPDTVRCEVCAWVLHRATVAKAYRNESVGWAWA
jgi:hypothetical protein